MPRIRTATTRGEHAVSYLPIHVPIWASLPSDPKFYSRPTRLNNLPDILSLDDTSSCSCLSPRTLYSPFLGVEERHCAIFMTSEAKAAKIQLQSCPTCSHRFIGPDLRDQALFNFNNQIIFAHDLLDEYTSAFTTSEMPFAAWIITVTRRYEVNQSAVPFVNEKMLRNVWFSYTQLQALDTDIHCPECGPDPEDTIWDGVTLAFSQKHLLPSLRPPTSLHETSLQRLDVRYRSGQLLIPEVSLRKAVRLIVQGSSLAMNPDDRSDDGDEDNIQQVNKAKKDQMSRVELIPDVCAKLEKVHKSLGTLFTQHYGIATLLTGREPLMVYKRLFIQVST